MRTALEYTTDKLTLLQKKKKKKSSRMPTMALSIRENYGKN